MVRRPYAVADVEPRLEDHPAVGKTASRRKPGLQPVYYVSQTLVRAQGIAHSRGLDVVGTLRSGLARQLWDRLVLFLRPLSHELPILLTATGSGRSRFRCHVRAGRGRAR